MGEYHGSDLRLATAQGMLQWQQIIGAKSVKLATFICRTGIPKWTGILAMPTHTINSGDDLTTSFRNLV